MKAFPRERPSLKKTNGIEKAVLLDKEELNANQ